MAVLQSLYDYGPCDRDIKNSRENVLRKHACLNKYIVARFKQLAKDHFDIAVANRFIFGLDRKLQIGASRVPDEVLEEAKPNETPFDLSLKSAGAGGIHATATDEEKCQYAGVLADSVVEAERHSFDNAVSVGLEQCLRMGFDFPLVDNKETAMVTAVKKLQDPMWWRRKIRTEANRLVEEVMRELGKTHVYDGLYVSNVTFARRCSDQHRNQTLLELMQAVNQDGDEYTLAELAELGLSNPENRHAEMIVRVKGLEAWASYHGDAAGFFTLTCPSRFHPIKKNPFRKNKKWDGSTVREAHQYLNKVWQRVYSAWNRAGIHWYGMWISEPHHDGTPHRHGIVFCKPHQFRKMTRIFQEYAFGIHPCSKRQIETKVPRYRGVCTLEQAGGEKGAAKHRFAMERLWYRPEDEERAIRAGKKGVGSVIGYIIKYISKNITTSMAGQVGLDDYGELASVTCHRVAAWAGVHGIRQFNFCKCPPVGVYRELRKLDAEREEHVQNWQKSQNASDDTKALLARARAAADAGDFFGYLQSQGGVALRRADYRLQLWKMDKYDIEAGRYQIGRYGEAVEGTFGLQLSNFQILTKFHRWTISQLQLSEAPRTCVNNSTLLNPSPDIPEPTAEEIVNTWLQVRQEAHEENLKFREEWEHWYGPLPNLTEEQKEALRPKPQTPDPEPETDLAKELVERLWAGWESGQLHDFGDTPKTDDYSTSLAGQMAAELWGDLGYA